MKKENIDKLLGEIVSSQGFINLDQNDINTFKNGVNSIDAIKVSGKNEQVGDLLTEAINSLKQWNREKSVKKLLFTIKLPSENNFIMEDMSKMREALDILEEDVECVWGISTSEDIESGNIDLIVAIGFNS